MLVCGLCSGRHIRVSKLGRCLIYLGSKYIIGETNPCMCVFSLVVLEWYSSLRFRAECTQVW